MTASGQTAQSVRFDDLDGATMTFRARLVADWYLAFYALTKHLQDSAGQRAAVRRDHC
jgi:hypothetical protein